MVKRTSTTDFDRFKIMVLRKQRAYKVKQLTFKMMGGKSKASAKGGKAAPAKAPAAAGKEKKPKKEKK